MLKFLNVINHNEGQRGTLREYESEVIDILPFHRIDKDKVKIVVSESRNYLFGVPPNSMDIFYLTISKVFYSFIVSVPGILYCCSSR